LSKISDLVLKLNPCRSRYETGVMTSSLQHGLQASWHFQICEAIKTSHGKSKTTHIVRNTLRVSL